MPYTKEDKKRIQEKLKAAGIKKGFGHIFNMINDHNQGYPVSEIEIENAIQSLMEEHALQAKPALILNGKTVNFTVFGKKIIARNALDDMKYIMQLPGVIGGAVMPDGHRVAENKPPVGSVVVTRDMFYPSFVGSDISCSVLITILDTPIDSTFFTNTRNMNIIKAAIQDTTYFGQATNPDTQEIYQYLGSPHEMRPALFSDVGKHLWHNLDLPGIAANQFSTSGDGNHFFNVGMINARPDSGRPYTTTNGNQRLAIMSHWGSRKPGAIVATTFEKAAMDLYEIPKGVKDAPLSIETDLGLDYWALMNWCGDFAYQGHRAAHNRFIDELYNRLAWSPTSSASVYSRHNFAWFDIENNWYVHRKGATPVEQGQYGIIPATMGDKSKLVRGIGNPKSFDSASHGAGRVLSRGQALQELKGDTADYVRHEYGIELIGGGNDEDPRAYKKIDEVMNYQLDCVSTVADFTPMVVRMAEPRSNPWGK